MKTLSQSHPMHINRLPKDIVLNILTHLPLQDAVRTSVLSRQWRYAWIELPHLIFNDSFCGKSILNIKSELLMAIYQVLLLHRGPLCEFALHLSNLDGSCSQIDHFLLDVVKKGVKELEICIIKGKPYSLPSSIFAYGQQFEDLKLVSCVFKAPSGFNGFSKLETLELEEVHISGSILSSLISNCPLLEWLDFRSSISYDHLDIVAPNLEYLCISCPGMSLCFENTPKLAEVEIYCRNIGDDILDEIVAFSDFMLSGSLPVIEELTLDDFYLQYATESKAPRLLVNDLCHLKTLAFSFFHS